jgi:predicted RNA-binding protein YlqC (UPF0109 family)
MQELKIYDVELDTNVTLNNMAESPDAVEFESEDESENLKITVNIFREDAKQIISFLQNYFNL